MNTIIAILKIFPLLFLLLLTSCITYMTTDIPSIEEKTLNVPLQDVTYSVEYYPHHSESSNAYNDFVKNIRSALEESKIFKKIRYEKSAIASPLHLHFTYVHTGSTPQDQFGSALLSGYTILTIPSWLRHNVDITMSVRQYNREIYSVTAPSSGKCLIWLPCIILCPVYNRWTAEAWMLDNTFDYFMNSLKTNVLSVKE